MRSIEDIRDTGAAWVTEVELAMLCAFAKRAEVAEIEAKKYHDALVARHGGESVALLQELDEARAKLAEAQAEIDRLREALIAYDKLSLVIESAVRERRDRDSREEGNYELLLRVIAQARAALRGGR